ncbi:MAG: HlyD family efflux transporter periplasmic adaptor subunit [Saprospiraceae bacterium]|nr:HlyD family efflux transporter periplasmic adaptor subunit [Saprospiraceae bacterium]
MDREISTQDIQKKKNKNWLRLILLVAAVSIGVWLLRGVFSTTVKRTDIRTAIVEVGAMENTLTASGEVQPEFEQVVTSPIAAILQQAYFDAGAQVKMGDKLVELDKEFTKIEFEKQRDQLDLKRNSVVKLKLELDKNFYDLKISDSIKAYKINSLQADLENAKRLFKAGGGTREAIAQAETNLHIAQLEKRQLENDIRTRNAVTQASIKESEITAAIQEKELREFERKLQQANIVANRAGVLTFINKNLGTKVNEGEILARIADLNSFKILGSISDNYASQIHVGMPVVVKVNEATVRASIVNIHPSVSNNVLTFDVALDDKNVNAQLRPKLKVEIFLVTASQKQTLRVANGAAFKGGSVQDVFVMRPDGKAERRTVKIGLTNFDFVEITEGVQKGETVIISDLSKYKNVNELEIR